MKRPRSSDFKVTKKPKIAMNEEAPVPFSHEPLSLVEIETMMNQRKSTTRQLESELDAIAIRLSGLHFPASSLVAPVVSMPVSFLLTVNAGESSKHVIPAPTKFEIEFNGDTDTNTDFERGVKNDTGVDSETETATESFSNETLTNNEGDIHDTSWTDNTHSDHLHQALASITFLNAELLSTSHSSCFSSMDFGRTISTYQARERIERVSGAVEVGLRALVRVAREGEILARRMRMLEDDESDGATGARGEGRGLLLACELMPRKVEAEMAEVVDVMGRGLGYGVMGPVW